MREIKFRAWDKEGKEMFRVISIAWPYENGIAKEIIVCGRGGCMSGAILMQSTGLHDKNGKEIYECDVIRVGNPKGLYTGLDVVEWDSSGCFKPFVINEVGGYDYNICPNEIEVVGDIYSNPELLNKES